MNKFRLSLLVVITATVVGCGGGAGSDDSPQNSSHDPIKINNLSESEVSSDGGFNGAVGTTSSTLVSDTTKTLQDTLAGIIPEEQAVTIAGAAAARIEEDGYSNSDSASEVLPSMLAGAMTGIGQLNGLSDSEINSLIEQSIATVMGLLGDDTGTARAFRSVSRSFEETQSLLEILVDKAVEGLQETKLSTTSLGAGVGKVVSAVVSNLDKARVPSDSVTSAVGKVVSKSMESLSKLPDEALASSVDEITSNAIRGAGNLAARDSNISLSESVGKAVSSVVKNLDKAKVDSADVAAKVESVVSNSMESLENFSAVDLTDTVDQITQSAIAGTKELKKTKTDIDLGESVGKVVSSVVKNLKKAKVNSTDVSASVERVVSKSMESLEDGGLTAEEVNASVQKITDGAVQGAGTLAKEDPNVKAALGTVISTVAKSATENLANLFSAEELAAVQEVIKSTIDESVNVIILEVYVDVEEQAAQTTALKEKATEGSNLGLASLPMMCNFGNRKVPDGKTVTAYQTDSVSFGESCLSEVRTCIDGELDGDYQFKSCKVDKPEGCAFGGQMVEHGQSFDAYFEAKVAFGETCLSQVRSCNDGILGGNINYSFPKCEVKEAKSCELNGKNIPHEESITTFFSASAAFAETCQSQVRSCVDGALSGSYKYESCEVASAASCEINGQTILHGESFEAFSTSSVPAGDSCVAELRFCNNGELSGSYDYASCKVDEPVDRNWGRYEHLKTHIQNAQAATVKITHSSATMINEKFAITAAHSPMDENWEVTPNLTVTNIFGEVRDIVNVFYTSEEEDLAIVELSSPFEKSFSVKIASETASTGDEIFGVGHPAYGYDWSVTFGKAVNKITDGGIHVDHDLYVTSGFSGGGIYNSNGELISVISGGGASGSRSGIKAKPFSENFKVINSVIYPNDNIETHVQGPSMAVIQSFIVENNIPDSVLVEGGGQLPLDPVDPPSIADKGYVPDKILDSISDLAITSRHSTVAISHNNSATYEDFWANGTGVVISEDLILTVGHIVDEEYTNYVSIMFPDGTVYNDNVEVAFRMVHSEKGDIDLALIRINGELPKGTVIAELASNDMAKGDYGYFVGNPSMLWKSEGGWHVSAGQKTGGRDFKDSLEFELNSHSIGGFSGSGMFNLEGKIVGILGGGGCGGERNFFNIQDPHESSYSPIEGSCVSVGTRLSEIRNFIESTNLVK